MFDNQRYITRGIDTEIPLWLQVFMWEAINFIPKPDYLQIFRLEPFGTMQRITHEQEQPPFRREYLIPTDNPMTQKIYIIDSTDYNTMLLAEEY